MVCSCADGLESSLPSPRKIKITEKTENRLHIFLCVFFFQSSLSMNMTCALEKTRKIKIRLFANAKIHFLMDYFDKIGTHV